MPTAKLNLLNGTQLAAGKLAADDEETAKKRARVTANLRPSTTIVIHFTARSGSSWLTSVLAKAGLGVANELYNPTFFENIAHNLGARSLGEYVDLTSRFMTRGNVLSLEVTSHHIKALFSDPRDFFETYRDATHFWLIRQDIVAQAVSLHKMVTEGLNHSNQSTPEEREIKDRAYAYDNAGLQKWLRHLHVSEKLSEQYFQIYGINPVRISYEDMTQKGAEAMLKFFRLKSGLDQEAAQTIATTPGSELIKIGTSKNADYAARFRHENRRLLKSIDAERAKRLELVQFLH